MRLLKIGVLVLVIGTTVSLFAKGEYKFKNHESGAIRGTESNPVVKGIEELVHKININWAAIDSKRRQIKDFSGLMTDAEDSMRYRELQNGLKMDEIAYKLLLKELANRLSNTYSKIDDKDISERLKLMKKYETKDNFMFMSKIMEWEKEYEERATKQKELQPDSNDKPEEDDSLTNPKEPK